MPAFSYTSFRQNARLMVGVLSCPAKKQHFCTQTHGVFGEKPTVQLYFFVKK